MAKKTVPESEGALKDVAVAVGSALGKLAQKIGLEGPAVSSAVEPPKKKSAAPKAAVANKSAAPKKTASPKKKIATKKKVATKKAAPKRASRKTPPPA